MAALFAEYEPRPEQTREPLPDGSIRLSLPLDAAALAEIAQQRHGGSREDHERKFAAESLARDSERLLLVCEAGGIAVAYARATRFEPSPGAPDNVAPAGWYLGGVVVSPAHWRKGIASALTEKRLAWIAERAHEAYAFVNAQNRASLDLLARFGFRELTRDFTYPGVTFTGGAGVLLRADLRGERG